MSIFFVLCLSITRTLSLVRPFQKQRVKLLLITVATYFTIQLIQITAFQVLQSAATSVFYPGFARCDIKFRPAQINAVEVHFQRAVRILTYVAPAFVVAISSVISAISLSRQSSLQTQQSAIHRSRRRATWTILLFALVYGVCNVPFAIDYITKVYQFYVERRQWHENIPAFDEEFYFYNTKTTLMLAVNSAVNPVLYFWRMGRLRAYVVVTIRRVLRMGTREG